MNNKHGDRIVIKQFIVTLIESDFVRKVAETFAARILLIGIGIVTSAVVARILGPDGRGLYGVAVAVGAIGVQFGNIGLHASNTYFVAKDRSLLSTLFGNTLVVSFIFGGIFSAIAWLVFLFFPGIAPLTGVLLALSLMWIPLGLAYMLMQNLLLGIHEIRAYNKLEIVSSIIPVFLMGVLIISGVVTAETVFLAGFVGLAVSFGWAFFLLKAHLNRSIRPSFKLFKEYFPYGLKAYLSSFFIFLVLRVDLFMVKHMLGAEMAGYYSIAANMAEMVGMFTGVVATILFPKLISIRDVREKWQSVKKVLLIVGMLMLIFCLFFAIFSHWIVALMFGRAYLPAVPAFILLLPAIYLLSLGTILGNFNASIMIPLSSVPFTMLVAVLNILLNLVLIKRYGIIGASISSIVCYGLIIPYNVYYVRVYLRRADGLV